MAIFNVDFEGANGVAQDFGTSTEIQVSDFCSMCGIAELVNGFGSMYGTELTTIPFQKLLHEVDVRDVRPVSDVCLPYS